MKIAIIGAGNMGGALADGLLKAGFVEGGDLIVSCPTIAKLSRFAQQGATVTANNREAVEKADVVIIAVKPWLVEQVLGELDTTGKSVVSVAAGITLNQLTHWTAPDTDLWLAIPNIAASEMASMTFLVEGRTTGKADVKAMFDAIGDTIVCEEKQLSAGTTLASCGIAYAMRYIRAASEGGVELGFRATEALRIVMQTLYGSVKLLEATGLHPEQLVDHVTTAGGLAIRGLNEMECAGFSSSVIRGLKAGQSK